MTAQPVERTEPVVELHVGAGTATALARKHKESPEVIRQGLRSYRIVMQQLIRSEIGKAPNRYLTEATLSNLLVDLVKLSRKPFSSILMPVLTAEYALAFRRAGLGEVTDRDLSKIAAAHAGRIADYFGETSNRAAMQGFNTLVNRGTPARGAIERVIEAWGLSPKQMSGLTSLKQTPVESGAKTVLNRVKRYIETSLGQRVKTIGDQEAHNLSQQAEQVAWSWAQEQGLTSSGAEKIWITAKDERTCPVCRSLHGRSVGIDEPFVTEDGDELWIPGAHVNCVPAGTYVSGFGVRGVSTRWFEGEMVSVRTASGKELTATPNHPVLTREGWIGIGSLQVGGEIFHALGGQWMSGVDQENGQTQPVIEDVVAAALMDPGVVPVEVPVAAPDFHGDGGGSQIAVVASYGALTDVAYPEIGQALADDVFERRDTDQGLLVADRAPDQFLFGARSSSDCVVRGSGPSSTLLGSRPHGLESIGFALGSGLEAVIGQSAGDGVPGDGEPFAEALDGLTGAVGLDEIVEVRTYPFRGHVYNLETQDGWYIGNGIVTHNCRCVVRFRDPLVNLKKSANSVVSKDFEAMSHPRWPKGHPKGGKFRPSNRTMVREDRESPAANIFAQIDQELQREQGLGQKQEEQLRLPARASMKRDDLSIRRAVLPPSKRAEAKREEAKQQEQPKPSMRREASMRTEATMRRAEASMKRNEEAEGKRLQLAARSVEQQKPTQAPSKPLTFLPVTKLDKPVYRVVEPDQITEGKIQLDYGEKFATVDEATAQAKSFYVDQYAAAYDEAALGDFSFKIERFGRDARLANSMARPGSDVRGKFSPDELATVMTAVSMKGYDPDVPDPEMDVDWYAYVDGKPFQQMGATRMKASEIGERLGYQAKDFHMKILQMDHGWMDPDKGWETHQDYSGTKHGHEVWSTHGTYRVEETSNPEVMRLVADEDDLG